MNDCDEDKQQTANKDYETQPINLITKTHIGNPNTKQRQKMKIHKADELQMNITKCKTQAENETQQKCKVKTHKGDELQMNTREHKMQVKSITRWENKRYGKKRK